MRDSLISNDWLSCLDLICPAGWHTGSVFLDKYIIHWFKLYKLCFVSVSLCAWLALCKDVKDLVPDLMKMNKWKILIGQGQYCDRNKKVLSDNMERTSSKQRGLEGRKKWLPSCILKVMTPGAEGAVVWQSLQCEWRAKILELDAVQCEHSKGRERTKLITEEQDEGFGFCSEKLKAGDFMPCISGGVRGWLQVGKTPRTLLFKNMSEMMKAYIGSAREGEEERKGSRELLLKIISV